MTINDHKLDQIAKEYAIDIVADGGDPTDLAHEYADGSEWAIYYNKAHELCQNCNTDNGEQYLEDCGPPETPTYDSIASYIAYGELYGRIVDALNEMEGIR